MSKQTVSKQMGRPRAGERRLTKERILEAALRLIDEDGVEGFSMRRLAAALGVDPMAIYHYLPGRDAVIDGAVESVFRRLRGRIARAGAWRERVHAFARAYCDLVAAHPRLALHLAAHLRSGGETLLIVNEILYQALEEGGLSPAEIVAAADLIVDYVNGKGLAMALQNAGDDLADLLAKHPPSRFPALRRILEGAAGASLGDPLQKGVEIILSGLRPQSP